MTEPHRELSAHAVEVRYGAVQAVRGVELAVRPGRVTALLGSNGAGKSSLLGALAGIVPASRGTVRLDGADITRWSAERRTRAGAVLVPEGRRVFARLSVDEHLLLGAGVLPRGERAAAIEEVRALFPVLREKATAAAGGLSGGQQQQLAIGRALVSRPRYVLLDEPSLGLAPLVVDTVFEAVDALRRRGLGVLLVDQNAERAAELADEVLLMERGTVRPASEQTVHDFYGFGDGPDAAAEATPGAATPDEARPASGATPGAAS